jgi:CheY-like chemotaxis protein
MVLEIASDVPSLLNGDVGKIRQLVLNLLSNAAKFTEAGQVKLVVGGRADGDIWKLCVAVEDSGIGIPQHKIDQLFERFVQADASTTRIYGGTGLGLAICQRLAALLGGQVGAENRPQGGSRFSFEVPVRTVSERRSNPVRTPVEMPSSARILLADDAAPNRELVSLILGSLGFTIDTVCDGSQALETVRSGEYDLVLMDVHMPVMDGMAATRAIRALGDHRSRTPIIALTANVLPDQIALCHAAGMDAHVAKPIQIAELAKAIATCLSNKDDERQPKALEGTVSPN